MINRNNYETSFLMYVDNELSITEKEMVEAFAQQNPDLRAELHMLQQTVLLPEKDILFINKNLLHKHIGNEVTITNYEEKFLLYIHDELSAKDKAQVETFVLQHPQLQNNFTVLQHTKLLIETIVCPNKQDLYKHKKSYKVIYMQWFKIAAAAVFIGFIALLYFVLPTHKINSNNSVTALPKNTVAPNNYVIPKNTASVKVTSQNKQQIVTAIALAISKSNKNTIRIASIKNTLNATTDTTTQLVIIKPNAYKQDAIENLQIPLITTKKNDEIFVTNGGIKRTTKNTITTEIIDEPVKLSIVTITKNNTTVQQVIYKELETNSDEKSLLVGSLEINKDKLRGFLRKAAKLFGNKQKTDDNNLAFAANK